MPRRSFAGNIAANNGETADVDSFLIGRMNAGVVVDLSLQKPTGSTLNGEVRVVDAEGNLIADGDGTINEVGTFTTTEPGNYYAQVLATSGAGSNASYVLSVEVQDDVPPEVVAVSQLPAEAENRRIPDETHFR